MTREKLARALPALTELGKLSLPYATARQVRNWMQAAQDNQAGLRELWEAMMARYGAQTDGQGRMTFQTQEDKESFAREWRQHVTERADTPEQQIDMKEHVAELRVSAAILEALDGAVIWEDKT